MWKFQKENLLLNKLYISQFFYNQIKGTTSLSLNKGKYEKISYL